MALLRQAGAAMAVATDCNPGSSPCTSLLLTLNMACTVFGLTPQEALSGVTRHAARALGLRRWPVMRKVILPQAVRRMIPPFVNQSITQLKNTSLVSTIAVPDLLYNGTMITADTYRPLEVYTVVAVIYFVLLFPSTMLAQWYEKRLQTDR